MTKKRSREKVIVMLSGGLDSRLVVKILQEQGFDVIGVYFKLPFSKDEESEIKTFSKEHCFKIKIFDYTKGKLFNEYIKLLKKPKFGCGKGVNPCIDCRIFMLKKAKQFADKKGIEFIATGEVLGQRPMSQHAQGLKIVEKESGLGKRLIRPLIEKGINGRTREKQISFAKSFKIPYPNPAGGCLLCEKALKNKFKFLIKRGLKDKEVKLVNVGRHFIIDNCWIILGKDKEENNIIERLGMGELIVSEGNAIGPSAVILDKCNEGVKEKVKKLIRAYSRGADIKERDKFSKYLL